MSAVEPSILVFPDLLRWRAASSPDGLAMVVDGGGSLTFGSWDHRSDTAAAGLAARGVQSGDRVALLFDSARWIDYAVAYLAVHKAGGVAVPLAPRFTSDELAYVFGHCEASALVCPPDLTPASPPGWVAHPAELAEGRGGEPFQAPIGPYDLADILYTSGTTGRPKGVACTHENVVYRLPPDKGDLRPVRFLHAFPIGTNAGQEVLRVPLRRANTTAHTLARFDPEPFCALIATHGVQRLQLVPAMAQMILVSGAHRRHDVSSIERITLGSAPTPPSLLPRLAEAFPTAEVWNVYTLTESGPARTLMVYDPDRPGSVGKPVWGSEVKVADDDGGPLPAGQTGEVWLRLEGAPRRSYYRDPEATAATFVADWLKTGDVGYLDDGGCLFLVDRKKDVIISGGFNVSSVEVEGALHEHPAVTDAAVFGLPHEVLGQHVAAAVVTSAPVGERELQSFVRLRLADYKVPNRIVSVEAIPRNASGKILKRQLREGLVAVAASAEAVAPRSPVEERIASIWADVLDVESVGVHDDFFENGGHSLAATQMAARLQDAFGVDLDVALLFEAPTVAELADAVQAAPSRSTG